MLVFTHDIGELHKEIDILLLNMINFFFFFFCVCDVTIFGNIFAKKRKSEENNTALWLHEDQFAALYPFLVQYFLFFPFIILIIIVFQLLTSFSSADNGATRMNVYFLLKM